MLISWKKNSKINGLEATECYLFLAREKSRVQAAFSFQLVFPPICRKSGVRFLSQSQTVTLQSII